MHPTPLRRGIAAVLTAVLAVGILSGTALPARAESGSIALENSTAVEVSLVDGVLTVGGRSAAGNTFDPAGTSLVTTVGSRMSARIGSPEISRSLPSGHRVTDLVLAIAPGAVAPVGGAFQLTGADGAVLDLEGASSQSVSLPIDGVADYTWHFAVPGEYLIPFQVSATTTDSAGSVSVVDAAVAPYSFTVEAAPPAETAPPVPVTDAEVYVPNGSLTASGATVLNDGHVDIASTMRDGAFTTQVKDTSGAGEVWREPSATVLQLLPESHSTVPEDPAYGFLGTPGAPVWQLPLTQQEGLLWPGWSTEALDPEATAGVVTWRLNGVRSHPAARVAEGGDFSLYELGGFDQPRVLLDSANPAASAFVIPKSVHAHGVWSFTREGAYCLAFTRSAETAAGEPLRHDFVLTVAVGRVAVSQIDPAACFEGTAPDQPLDPTAPVTPPLQAPVTPITDSTPPSTAVAATQCVAGATILSSGHVDYASRIIDGQLQSQIKDGTTRTIAWRDPADTVLWLKPSAGRTLPAGKGYEAIGAPGAPVWEIAQSEVPGLVWLGWNTESIPTAQAASPVTWTLNSVDGPGTVKVYLKGSFGQVSDVVLGNGSSYEIPLGTHAHGNWAFSAEGVYRLSLTQSITLTGGARSSDTATLTIAVGDIDPRTAIAGTSGCGAVPTSATRSAADEAAALAAAQAAAQAASDTSGNPVRPDRPTIDNRTAAIQQPESTDSPVLVLTLILGGLLLIGAATTGFLWSRRTAGSNTHA